MLTLLVAAHFIADFPLQTDAIAAGKNRNLGRLKFGVNWWYWLTAHSMTHGVAVGLVTGNALLGTSEAVAHWLIDYGKCERWFGLHVDQALHLLCKVAWIVLVLA